MKEAHQILSETLSERTSANPRYSLRAFARDLKISPQQLSNVMNARRGMSVELAERIANKLELDLRQRTAFVESLKAKFSRSVSQRAIARAKLRDLAAQSEIRNLDVELFQSISSWYHFTLIELIKLSTGKKDPLRWFARKLDISENEIALSLERLERVGLISHIAGRYQVNQESHLTDREISTESVRKYHRQILEKALQALAFQGNEERYGSSSTLPIRVKNVAHARKLIQDFRLAFTQEVSDSQAGEEVYGLSIHFFRLTQSVLLGSV